MRAEIEIQALYDVSTPYLTDFFATVRYPFELLTPLNNFICSCLDRGLPGFERRDNSLLVGEGVTIAPTAVIDGPAILGPHTEVRHGAYLRGNVITGGDCVIGNSSELKNCILLERVQVPHYNYVGDSILGNRVHLGAGSICSNLKADGKSVVIRSEPPLDTKRRKVGAFLGDGADIGCGCVLNPGCVIGRNTRVYPLTSLRGVIGRDLIVKASENIIDRQ